MPYRRYKNPRDCYMISIRVEEQQILKIRDIFLKYFFNTKKIQKNPHITLFQCINMNIGYSEDFFFKTLEDCAGQFSYLPYRIEGFFRLKWWSESQRIIAHTITASPELDHFTQCLVKRLFQEHCNVNSPADGTWTDKHPEDKELHITIAWKLSIREAEMLWGWLDHDPGYFYKFLSLFKSGQWKMPKRKIFPVKTQYDALRLTLFKNNKIIAEYDLPRKIWITGDDIWNNQQWEDTVIEYQRIIGSLNNPY